MRIWSLHPKYLDSKGLVALWRETLLAKNVLEGNTKGYKNHPQLNRFKISPSPLDNINYYLEEVYHEAKSRGYNFDSSKFEARHSSKALHVTSGQMEYETEHLKRKLQVRDYEKFVELEKSKELETHPLFKIVPGRIESWEII